MMIISGISVTFFAWITCSAAFVSPLTICSSGITRCNSSTRLGYRIGPLQSHNTQPRLRPVLRHPPNFSGSSLGWDGYKTVRRRTELGMVPKARASPQLTEDELSEMAAMREKANKRLEDFLLEKEALSIAKMREELEQKGAKIKERVKAEKEKVDQAKRYIPQRLQEIEQEEALLRGRVTDFNAKIKDTDLQQL